MIFTEKSFTTIAAVALIIIFIIFAWVGILLPEGRAELTEELENNRELWRARQPDSYSYHFDQACMFRSSAKVLITNDETRLESDSKILPAHEVLISQVFDSAEKAISQSARVNIVYHDYYGFPKRINVDWSEDSLDDECLIELSEFKLMPNKDT